ncbi:transporter [Mesorhizobium sp. IMUNJ 23033]|uniref:EamA family transporter n=1 Tax=Mesorhizobium sp. IMUNJ 23033 TaxID=3378039 RepID=UPI00384A7241
MKAGHFLWLGMPVLSTLSQLFIKLTSERLTGSGWIWLENTLTSRWMIAVLGVEIALFFIWMRVLTELDLSKAYPLSAISYILILPTGWLVFSESISALQLVGSGMILGGVWLISTGDNGRTTRAVWTVGGDRP